MPEKNIPPVTFITIGFQLFIFTFSLLFSHSGLLIIFLSFVHPLSFLCTSFVLILQSFTASSWFSKGDVLLFCMAVNKWKHSLVILRAEWIAAITRICHYLTDSVTISVQLVSYCVLVHHEPPAPNVTSTNAYKFMIIT